MAKPRKVEQDEVQSGEMTFNPSLEDQINIIREKMDNAKKNENMNFRDGNIFLIKKEQE